MKITHVVTSTNIGGAQIMLQRYLQALGSNARHHEVISLMNDGSIAGPIRAAGSRVTSLGMTSGLSALRAGLRLRAHLSAAQPDVVFGWMYHGCLAASAGVGLLPRRARPAVIWGIHHSLQSISQEPLATRIMVRILAQISPCVDLITYCSDTSRHQHKAVGFSDRRATLIPNAVDKNDFCPDPSAAQRLRTLIGVTDDRLLIGNVARNHPMKDHVSMVRAIAALHAEGHNVQGVMIGAGHTGSAAEAEIHKLGLQDRISLIGARDDVQKLVPGFDIFLLSSAWGEAFPLAVCEAMASEVPVVATDVGDCAELVGDTGIVVPPGDAALQARALARMITEGQANRQNRGIAARARISNLFSTQRYIAAHDEIYDRFVTGHGRTTAQDRSIGFAKPREES